MIMFGNIIANEEPRNVSYRTSQLSALSRKQALKPSVSFGHHVALTVTTMYRDWNVARNALGQHALGLYTARDL
jgi:hypothetical protein